MVPAVPSDFRQEIKVENAWSGKSQLQSALNKYGESKLNQGSESAVALEIAEWQESSHGRRPESTPNGEMISTRKKRMTAYLKVNMGLPTGLWGYICFGRRKRRYEGRYLNEERGNDLASAKRLKSDTARDAGQNPDEDEDGEAVIATRFHLFSEVETVSLLNNSLHRRV